MEEEKRQENEVESVEVEETGGESRNEEETQNLPAVEEESCEVPKERPKGNKLQVARALIRQAQEEVKSAEAEIEECLQNIRNDLEAFEAYEKSSVIPVTEESRKLLQETGIEEHPQKPLLGQRVDLEDPEDHKIEIRELPTGRFGACVMALIGGAVTVGGWYYVVAMKTGLPLIPKALPKVEEIKEMLSAVPSIVKVGQGAEMGAAIVGGSVLIVMWLIYVMMVSSRASKNLRIAEKVEEDAMFYCTKKKECKEKMAQVREHIRDLENTVKKYEAVLQENNAGLRRAFLIEGTRSFPQLHERTKAQARATEELLRELDALLATPLAEGGMLTMDSANALARAEQVIGEYLEKLYGE